MNFYADFTVTETANFGISKFGVGRSATFWASSGTALPARASYLAQVVPQCVDKRGLAGVAGLEPTNGGIKTRCLTNLAIPQFLSSCPMWRTRYLCCSNLSNSGERFTPFATKLCQASGI